MRQLLSIVLFCLLAACGQAEPAILPTLTLVPPTATLPPSPIPPSVTPDRGLTSAESLLTPTIQTESTPPEDSLAEVDPIAAELVVLAQSQVSNQTELPTSRIRLVSVEVIRWTDTSLGCPQPDQTYESAEIDGYRIVLAAGDNSYIFHTDFDRVVACDGGDETLPDD